MNPDNVTSCFLIGDNLDPILFKVAIHFAENGLNVWFISPNTIHSIPENIPTPNKEVLKLITFLYLKSYKELLNYLNDIQLWHKKPNLLILNGFDNYCNLRGENYNSLIAGSICASLLDNAAASGTNRQTYLLISCSEIENEHCKRLKVLNDMYFPVKFNKTEDVTDRIIKWFEN